MESIWDPIPEEWAKPTKPQPKPSGYERYRLEETCHHEAAHATAAHQLGVPLQNVSVQPGGDSLGHTQLQNRVFSFDKKNSSPAEIEDFVWRHGIICLAGAAGSLLFSGNANWQGASGDLEALDSALQLVASSQIDQDTRKRSLWDEAKKLIDKNASLVNAVADALFEHRSLSGRQVTQVINETKMRTNG